VWFGRLGGRQRQQVSIYKIFADNLRTYSNKHGSIESVCRGIGINRQQFNKYLAGQVLPQARTLAKICVHFRIPEKALFVDPNDVGPDTALSSQHRSVGDSTLVATHMVSSVVERCPLPLGYYSCYFPMQHVDTHLVASSVCVFARGGRVYFSRRTAFRSPTNPRMIVAKGLHKGVILVQEAGVYLMGFNSVAPRHPSMICLDSNKLSGSQYTFGLAMTRGSSRSMASIVILKYWGRTFAHARTCLSSAGIRAISDPSLDPVVSMAFQKADRNQAFQLNALVLENQLLGLQGPDQSNPDSVEEELLPL
jgi:transcriptional regulator with XRE-family HTH domain